MIDLLFNEQFFDEFRVGGGRTNLKVVFAKNERGYRLNAIKKALLIDTNLTSICCVYKEKLVKDVIIT